MSKVVLESSLYYLSSRVTVNHPPPPPPRSTSYTFSSSLQIDFINQPLVMIVDLYNIRDIAVPINIYYAYCNYQFHVAMKYMNMLLCADGTC